MLKRCRPPPLSFWKCVYIFHEIYWKIAVYKVQCISADVCLWKWKKGTWRKHNVVMYCHLLILLMKHTQRQHICTYMRFLNWGGNCPLHFCFKLIYSAWFVLITEGKGSSENLPLFMVIVSRPGTNGPWHLLCWVHSCHNTALVFFHITFLLCGRGARRFLCNHRVTSPSGKSVVAAVLTTRWVQKEKKITPRL